MSVGDILIKVDCVKGVYLRNIKKTDTDMIIRWRNHPDVRKNFIYQKDFTRTVHNQWFDTNIMTGLAVQFIIVEENTKRPIGSVYLRDIDKLNHKAEYGIFIGEIDAQGHGYGTAACKIICQYAFEKLSLHKIFLRVFKDNIKARRSYEKAGFIEEGCFHDDVYIDGAYKDVVFMAMYN